jgi:acyl-CoA synthetase (AMP-forming)/AMP-acid ligase II
MNVMELALGYDKGRNYTGLFFEDQSFSNIKISEEARCFAQGLQSIGLKPSDIVATVLPNCEEILTVYEGVLHYGGRGWRKDQIALGER